MDDIDLSAVDSCGDRTTERRGGDDYAQQQYTDGQRTSGDPGWDDGEY